MKKFLIATISTVLLFGCATHPCPPKQRFAYVLSQSNTVVGSYTTEQDAYDNALFLSGPFRITPMLIDVPAVDNAGYRRIYVIAP